MIQETGACALMKTKKHHVWRLGGKASPRLFYPLVAGVRCCVGFQAALSRAAWLSASAPAVLRCQTQASWASEVSVCVQVHVRERWRGKERTRKGVIKKVCGRGVGKIQQPAVPLHTAPCSYFRPCVSPKCDLRRPNCSLRFKPLRWLFFSSSFFKHLFSFSYV